MHSAFSLGRTMATPGALLVAPAEKLATLLRRHASGDWGELDAGDVLANEEALEDGERLLSAYRIDYRRIWIITEADRSATTILLPEEY